MGTVSDRMRALRESFKPGTIRKWSDGQYIKLGDGTWTPWNKAGKTYKKLQAQTPHGTYTVNHTDDEDGGYWASFEPNGRDGRFVNPEGKLGDSSDSGYYRDVKDVENAINKHHASKDKLARE